MLNIYYYYCYYYNILLKIQRVFSLSWSAQGRHEEAISEHEMEKRASEALQDKIGEAVACRKIGECYCLLGHFDKALKLQNQYLALAQKCNDLVRCLLSAAWPHRASGTHLYSLHHLIWLWFCLFVFSDI